MLKINKMTKKGYVLSGLTMIELVITVAILILALIGFLRLFLYCSRLAEMSRNLTFAMNDIQTKLEEMRYYNFDRLTTDYAPTGTQGDTFALSQLDGLGKIYIDNSIPEMLQVDIVVSYRSAGNHIVGEDQNFNGSIDGAEDTNGNTRLDSPASIVSYISKR